MALQQILTVFSFKTEGTEQVAQANNLANKLTAGAQALAIAVAGSGLLSWIDSTIAATIATDAFGSKIGASAEDVAEWDTVMAEFGVATDDSRAGLESFAEALARTNKEGSKALSGLDVDRRGDFAQNLEETLEALRGVTDETKRAKKARDIFGDAGGDFVRVALMGADAIDEQREAFAEFLDGRSYQEYVDEAKEADRASKRLSAGLERVKQTIARALIPVFAAIVDGIAGAIRGFQRWVKGTKIVQVALVTLGVIAAAFAIKVAIAFAPMILSIGLFVAAVGAAVLIIEDIYQLFTGGESLIGRWLDDWLGAEKVEMIVAAIKEAVIDLVNGIIRLGDVSGPVIKELIVRFKQALGWIGKIAAGMADVVDKLGEWGAAAGGAIGEARGRAIDREQAAAAQTAEQAQTEALRTLGPSGRVGRRVAPEIVAGLQAAQAEGRQLTGKEKAAQVLIEQGVLRTGQEAPFLAPFLGPGSLARQGAGSVTINSPTQITVQGDANPDVTAARVLDAVDAKQQDDLRRAREALQQR